MGILDDTALFAAVVQQGGFSHAAKHLGLSNGLISRRIALLEKELGVTLIKRTTRQIQLTPEGELFWQHAQRIQQEIESALSMIHASAKKPAGTIRLSAPVYFGRAYLMPIILKFRKDYPDIHVNVSLSNEKTDLVKEQMDLVIRGAGYNLTPALEDSNLQMKRLLDQKVGLYASPAYLKEFDKITTARALQDHAIISYSDLAALSNVVVWHYSMNHNAGSVTLNPVITSNDIESCLSACIAGHGIAKLTQLNVLTALQKKQLRPVLSQYDWGDYRVFAIYPQQKSLPQRTRLLLDFIKDHMQAIIAIM